MKILNSLFRKKRASEGWLKYLSYLMHLWLGVVSSLVLIIVCLAGAIYSLKPIIEPLASNHISTIAVPNTDAKALSIDSLIRNFEVAKEVSPNYVRFQPDKAVLLRFSKRGGKSISVYYNPYSGVSQGSPNESIDSFFMVVMKLHRWLLVRKPGQIIVGSSVVIFVILLMSGLILWWPKRKNARKRSFSIKWRGTNLYRKLYDWHKIMGFYTLIPLLFLSITGLYFSFGWVRDGIKLGLGGTVEHHEHHEQKGKTKGRHDSEKTLGFRNAKSKGKRNKQPAKGSHNKGVNKPARLKFTVPLQQTLDKVYQKTPYAGETTVRMPRKPGGAMRITRYNTNNILAAKLPDRIKVQGNGELIWENFNKMPLYKQFSSIVKGLHTGELFLPWVSLIYFLLALMATSLPITGLYMWIKRL